MKSNRAICCWQIRVEDLVIFMASSNRGALEVHLSLEQGLETLQFFDNRFPHDYLIEDAEKNESLARVIKARLMNKPANIALSFDMQCTLFQMIVWKAIAQIPFGRTKTYGEVADFIGKQGGGRAVGQAVSKNPLPIIFP